MADSLVLKTSFSTIGNWARNAPLAFLVQRSSAHSWSITLALFSNISLLAPTHTTDHVASMTFDSVFDDSFLLGALAITKDFNVDDQGLIQTRWPNPQDEITLVDAVGGLKARLSFQLFKQFIPPESLRKRLHLRHECRHRRWYP